MSLPWTCSVNWCLAEDCRNGDQCHPVGGPIELYATTTTATITKILGKLKFYIEINSDKEFVSWA